MPKTRGSNTVAATGRRTSTAAGGVGTGAGGAAGSGNGPIEEVEIIDRLQDRLDGVRTVTVGSPSGSRRRNENVDVTLDPNNPGFAQVRSESGSTYDVDYINNTCTCEHHRYRRGNCRHIEATNTAIGQVLESRDNSSTETGQSLAGADMGTALNAQQISDAQNEEARLALSGIQEDDNYFYSDHPEEFRETLNGMNNEDLPYEYHNVLNGSNNTFGIELEFVGGNPNAIAKELYDLGICGYDHRVEYHAPSVSGKWKLERDGSVSDWDSGGELVSPILRDTPETWRNIEIICEVARKHGARVDSNCGGHVHIGMEPLDTARQRWRRFFKSMAGYEECIYRYAGGDLGRVRSNHYHYAKPFNNISNSASSARFVLENEQDVRNLVDRIQPYSPRYNDSRHENRYYGINMTNIPISDKPNTIEFRYFNGSINAKTIQNNVRLANGVITASVKARTKETSDGAINESMRRRGEMLKNETGSSPERNDNAIMKFVDIMFTRKKDKDHILEVFSRNSWR